MDTSGEIVRVNAAWDEAAREREAKASATGVGVNYFDVLMPALAEASAVEMARDLRSVLEGHATYGTVPYDCQWEGGKTWHVARICAVETDASQRLALIGHHDVSGLIHNEEQREQLSLALQQAQATGSRILEVVSHELRTPLTTVRGNADVLARRRSELSPEQQLTALDDIRHDAERLRFTIENMISLAQPQDAWVSEPEPLLLGKLLEKAAQEHVRLHRDRPVEAAHPDHLPAVLGREGDVRLVLLNLLSNAAKYSDPGPALEVLVEFQAHHVLTTVLDAGIGIPPQELSHVMEPFYRCGNVAARESGVGIGLTVCQRLIERAGGQLNVQNRARGGVAASFSLPVAEEENQSPF